MTQAQLPNCLDNTLLLHSRPLCAEVWPGYTGSIDSPWGFEFGRSAVFFDHHKAEHLRGLMWAQPPDWLDNTSPWQSLAFCARL